MGSFLSLGARFLCKAIKTKEKATLIGAKMVVDDEESDVESKPELYSSTQVVNIVREIGDCNSRRCNLMIHNLPEPKESSNKVRASNDAKTVERMIKEKVSVSDVKISKVIRLTPQSVQHH